MRALTLTELGAITSLHFNMDTNGSMNLSSDICCNNLYANNKITSTGVTTISGYNVNNNYGTSLVCTRVTNCI